MTRTSHTTKSGKAKCLAYRNGSRCGRVAKAEVRTRDRVGFGHQSVCQECAATMMADGRAVGMVWGFGQQIARARQMRTEETRLEQAVASKQAYHDELLVRLEYVRSDEYVEQWARKDAKMARPGEVVVVVLDDAATEASDDTTSASSAESESRPFWVELWELIFAPSAR